MAESLMPQGLLPISPQISPTREVLEGENRRDLRHEAQLRATALWCLSRYRGIVTPTGRPKKPPTFQIVMCPDGHTGLTSSKTAKAQRYLCREAVRREEPVPAWNSVDIVMEKCGLTTEVIETIEEEQ